MKRDKRFLFSNLLIAVPECDDIGVSSGYYFAIFGDLHRTRNCRKIESSNFLTAASVPDTKTLVIGATHEGRLLKERDVSNTTGVSREYLPKRCALINYSAAVSRGILLTEFYLRRGLWFVEIKDTYELFVGSGAQMIRVVTEVHRLDDVIVLKRVQLLALYGIPDFGVEVSSSAGCFGCLTIQRYAPYRTFVTFEGSDPVPGVALSKHGLSI